MLETGGLVRAARCRSPDRGFVTEPLVFLPSSCLWPLPRAAAGPVLFAVRNALALLRRRSYALSREGLKFRLLFRFFIRCLALRQHGTGLSSTFAKRVARYHYDFILDKVPAPVRKQASAVSRRFEFRSDGGTLALKPAIPHPVDAMAWGPSHAIDARPPGVDSVRALT